MLSNKKGLEANILVAAIFSIVLIVVLIFILFSYKQANEGFYDKESCRNSVLLNSKRIEVAGSEIYQPFKEINCPTINQKVTYDDDQKILRVISNNLYDCWDKFGQGRIKFLNPESKTYCIVCSRIEFSGDAKGKEIPGFLEFLATKKIADDKGLEFSNLTYLEFLTPYETQSGILDKIKSEDNKKINTNNDYATVYLLYKNQKDGKLISGAKLAMVPCLINGVAIAGLTATGVGVTAVPFLMTLGGVTCSNAGIVVSGAFLGYGFGSDHSADWGARTAIVPYQEIGNLGCDAIK